MVVQTAATNGSHQPSFLLPNRLMSAKSVYEAAKKSKAKISVKTKKKNVKKTLKKVKAVNGGISKKKANKKSSNSDGSKKQKKAITDQTNGGGKHKQSFLDESVKKDENDPLSENEVSDESDDLVLSPTELSDVDMKAELAEEDKVAIEPKDVVYQTLEQIDYVMISTTCALIYVPFQTCFYFKGRLNLTVLCGTAEITGYEMEENPHHTYQAFSPRGYSLQCIRSVGKSDSDRLDPSVLSVLKSVGLKWSESRINAKRSTNVILLVQLLNSGMVDYITRLFPVNILRREDCCPPTWEDEKRDQFNQLCGYLDSSIVLRGAIFSARFYQQPDVWLQYTENLIEKAEPIRLMIFGGKGVGKSTLLRFIVNRLIKRFGSCLVVDFDPGQPELFPAGCVSATVVSQPLLGPNFTHFLEPIQSYFIGDVDITACPDRYVRSCRQLLYDCRMKPQLAKFPVIMNTMGFTTGVGVDVTLDLIRLAQPLQIIQVRSRSLRRNFPAQLSRDYVIGDRRGWLTHGDASLPEYSLEVIFSAAEDSERSLEEWGFRPSELRNIGLVSYFSRLSSFFDWTLTEATPYRISWQGLAVCICHESVPPSLTMAALNASLVALCFLDADAAASVPVYRAADGQHPTILRELPLIPCIGYGVVRGIDIVNGYVYLITPEPVDRLAQVNCLVMGGVRLPERVLLDTPLALRVHHGKLKGPKYHVPYATFGNSASQPACRPYRKYNPVFTLRNL